LSHVLAAGDLAIEVLPECGGGIARFDFGTVPLFRPFVAGGASCSAHDLGCFPLVPFSNRIANGRLPAARGDVSLACLPGYAPHPIHGLGWQRPWAVEHADATALDMTHAHRADAHWPFDYVARQSLRLTPLALEVTLALANAGRDDMPAGIGLHPFFPATPLATLETEVAALWHADAEVLPTWREDVPPGPGFMPARALAGTHLDNCYAGWNRRALLRWPERALALEITASATLATLVIYTPPGRDFFCVEPASHLNNGFQLEQAGAADTGVRTLAPGETLAGTVRFAPRAG
jgi:aldose 1-epimerase